MAFLAGTTSRSCFHASTQLRITAKRQTWKNPLFVSHHCRKRRRSVASCKVHKVEPQQQPEATATPSDSDDARKLAEELSRAPFQRVEQQHSPPLFPWRHSPEPLPRLVIGTNEFREQGLLLGGGIGYPSRTNGADVGIIAFFCLDVPWYQAFFFRRDWQEEFCHDMSWAFCQGVAGILSNTYRVPFDSIVSNDHHHGWQFELQQKEEDVTDNEEQTSSSRNILDDVNIGSMMEERLRELFLSANVHGKEKLQIKLDCQPRTSQLVNLFLFPMLSRRYLTLSGTAQKLRDAYDDVLRAMYSGPTGSVGPLYQELARLVYPLSDRDDEEGTMESTVICQVLVQCDEIFWVKDLATGEILQGEERTTPQKVFHLVRMEMVIKAHPNQGGYFPFRIEQGCWQITDIDDLLGGNLLLD